MEMTKGNGTQEARLWISKEVGVSHLPCLPNNMKIIYKNENLDCRFFSNGCKLNGVFLYTFLDITQAEEHPGGARTHMYSFSLILNPPPFFYITLSVSGIWKQYWSSLEI